MSTQKELNKKNIDFENTEILNEALTATEAEQNSFLPEPAADDLDFVEADGLELSEEMISEVEESELADFESAAIEELDFVEEERLESIIESVLFASDRPVSFAALKLVFKGTQIKSEQIRRALDRIAVEYAGVRRGVTLEEAPGGYQLRTKIDNMNFLRKNVKTRTFKLSGPALEVLSIVAYKQPVIKAEIDEIRGVESGHLLRALMERSLVQFEGKSDLPGKPMLYATTRKFLEIFGLRNLKELPTLSQIDELLPEGMTEDEAMQKPKLSDITGHLSENVGQSYSEGEEELLKIQEQLQVITTSSNFFEEEKRKQKERRDFEKAQNLRDALMLNEVVSTRDQNWLKKYDESLAAGEAFVEEGALASPVAAIAEEKVVESDNESAALFEDEEAAPEADEFEIASDREVEGEV
jgi:segregation and condensation protein B